MMCLCLALCSRSVAQTGVELFYSHSPFRIRGINIFTRILGRGCALVCCALVCGLCVYRWVGGEGFVGSPFRCNALISGRDFIGQMRRQGRLGRLLKSNVGMVLVSPHQ